MAPKPIDLTENNTPISQEQVENPVGCGGTCGGKCGTAGNNNGNTGNDGGNTCCKRQLRAFFYMILALIFVLGGYFVKRYFVGSCSIDAAPAVTSEVAPATPSSAD